MGGATAGARLGKSKEEGEKLLDNFFKGFPGVKKAIDDSKQFLKEHGYVEDFIGRRRRLTDITLKPYEVFYKNKDLHTDFNPFLICSDREIKDPIILKWERAVQEKVEASQRWQAKNAAKSGKTWTPIYEMSNAAYKELAAAALKEGVVIQANTGRISKASRQCFNARIQGSAATLTKLAMVDIAKDAELKECQAQLIIPVHDELLVECPAYYADRVEKRLPEVMINAAIEGGDKIPQSCDPYNVSRWYADTMGGTLLDEFKKLEVGDKKKNISPLSREEALQKVIENHEELPPQSIEDVITGKTEEVIF